MIGTTTTTIVDMGDMVRSNHGRPSKDDHNSSTSSFQEGDGDDQSASSADGSHLTGSNSDTDGRSSYMNGSTGNGTQENIFTKDGRSLNRARCCFLLTLLAAACAVGTVVGVITSNSQTVNFVAQFDDVAIQVIDISNANVQNVFHALEALSLTTTSFMKQSIQDGNNQYPDGFFTLPDAELHLGNARRASRATVVGYAPLVQNAVEYALWETYSQDNIDWVQQSLDTAYEFEQHNTTANDFFNPKIWYLKKFDAHGNQIVIDDQMALTCPSRIETDSGHNQYAVARESITLEDPNNGPFVPIWMESPPPNPNKPSHLNFNLMADPIFQLAKQVIDDTKATTFQDICSTASTWFNHSELESNQDLYSLVVAPVWSNHGDRTNIVGHYFAAVKWSNFFENVLDSRNNDPILVVMESQCGDKAFSYLLEGANATLVSTNQDVHVHSKQFENMAHSADFAMFAYSNHDTSAVKDEMGNVICSSTTFTITVYPTQTFEQNYTTKQPLYYTLVVLSIFLFTILTFCVFDWLVQRQQSIIMNTALRQNALVSSLFPKNIQKQLMEDMDAEAVKNKTGKAGLKSYLNNEATELEEEQLEDGTKSKPIADLFPETTIMFADIAGFTAWSSTREPSAVFTLLEAIYAEFDAIAKRRGVFKVEVVGDCYVAVTGLPDPRPDHAVAMAKFANDCVNRMFRVTRKLEIELGPDTAELGLRVGLHSGPVVAGVLRGDKSRFQLFGDTMNTASRMESNGVPGHIQISQDTADLLRAAGKEHWLKERDVKIAAKGKGELQTYFLQLNSAPRSSNASSSGTVTSYGEMSEDLNLPDPAEVLERRNRVAEWTVEVMAQQLKTIVGMRMTHEVKQDSQAKMRELEASSLSQVPESKTVIDEVAECIKLPDYSASNKQTSNFDVSEITLDAEVLEELRSYVQTIASLYNENPFHSFDHANHVVMSVNKLLSRINAPDLDECTAQEIHDHTYGITSDPLTWFACVYSALIHDVDHSGVPNAQLIKEGAPVATLYNSKSVAEQNSFDIAWDLLMEPSYENLRSTIYVNETEFKRFRQLVVNGVMATDIVDKDLKTLRNNRWDAAFDETRKDNEWRGRTLKATIIIEHLIQASDVAHTMQHWHIYRRWNERFFKECYQAYLNGRADANPAKTWYKGELGFFDFYIIPLAKKLKECGVFGVSSDEYLSYALQNRKEWEERGEEMVKEMVRSARREELAQAKKSRHANAETDL
ncbi:PAS domain containing protein [Nitzschia inconspicua]|uniref:PAS domain containing protein n=1 Tax=Nitzschia inconspicua TaxID=303405 RepID=A0A9K3QAI6_9STRA|nr:PAS domain containing protein [Nitzschia inconspicua]